MDENKRNRIVKLAGTISALAGSEEIQSVHLAKALQYRPKLMMSWFDSSNLVHELPLPRSSTGPTY